MAIEMAQGARRTNRLDARAMSDGGSLVSMGFRTLVSAPGLVPSSIRGMARSPLDDGSQVASFRIGEPMPTDDLCREVGTWLSRARSPPTQNPRYARSDGIMAHPGTASGSTNRPRHASPDHQRLCHSPCNTWHNCPSGTDYRRNSAWHVGCSRKWHGKRDDSIRSGTRDRGAVCLRER
jgi:hypothetical protein